MNKRRFFEYCRTHEHGTGVELQIQSGRRSRDMDCSVWLAGTWCGDCILHVELYRPRHQWPAWQERDAKIDMAVAKYERWLQEWLNRKSTKLVDILTQD